MVSGFNPQSKGAPAAARHNWLLCRTPRKGKARRAALRRQFMAAQDTLLVGNGLAEVSSRRPDQLSRRAGTAERIQYTRGDNSIKSLGLSLRLSSTQLFGCSIHGVRRSRLSSPDRRPLRAAAFSGKSKGAERLSSEGVKNQHRTIREQLPLKHARFGLTVNALNQKPQSQRT